MQLIYRGLTYNYNPSRQGLSHPSKQIHRTEPYTLRYRGSTYRIEPDAIVKDAAQPINYTLCYRGVTYWVNRDEQGKVTTLTSGVNP